VPTCRWCGRPAGDWACPACGGRALRAVVVGAARTAEELGRAFPGVPVRTSSGGPVLDSVDGRVALVIATPGAEPVVVGRSGDADVATGGGYGAALLLDGWALLSRPDLRAAEETLRRWMNAVALVRPDGQVVVGADASIATVQALVRWDPAGAAARELAERTELHFPPTARLAALTGHRDAVTQLLAQAELPEQAEVLGTSELAEPQVRTLVRAPRSQGGRLAAALKAAAAARSARKEPEPVKIVLDPYQLG
jgi:primosomal protein N' (replication factor Y)